jgi:D-aspartate ligase
LNNDEGVKGKTKVIVIDLDHINGLQTARIFAERNVPVIGIAKNLDHYCAKTRVCEKIIKADTTSRDLIDTLITIGNEFSVKPILIPCQDMSVLNISRNRSELEKFYIIALPASEVVEMLMDKPMFYEYARRENLPIASYYLLHNSTDALEASRNLNYPCILKPPIKSSLWEANTKQKAFKIFSAKDFIEVYNICSEWADVLMAQEWITGDDTTLYSCNCYFNKESRPLVTFTAKKLRQWPTETGNTSLGIECKAPEVEQETIKLFENVKYHGLGYLEMKKDTRTGKYFIIEPNIGRPTGRSALAEASGVELLYTMYCDLVGLELPKDNIQKFTGVKWIQLRTDLMSAFNYWLHGKLTLRQWIKSLSGKKMYAVFSIKDPLPFLNEVKFGIIFLLKSTFKKVRIKHITGRFQEDSVL